jgi:hypothetical protein
MDRSDCEAVVPMPQPVKSKAPQAAANIVDLAARRDTEQFIPDNSFKKVKRGEILKPMPEARKMRSEIPEYRSEMNMTTKIDAVS